MDSIQSNGPQDIDCCSICFEQFSCKHTSAILPCRHVFGEQCIVRWFDETSVTRKNQDTPLSTCPTCRNPWSRDDMILGKICAIDNYFYIKGHELTRPISIEGYGVRYYSNRREQPLSLSSTNCHLLVWGLCSSIVDSTRPTYYPITVRIFFLYDFHKKKEEFSFERQNSLQFVYGNGHAIASVERIDINDFSVQLLDIYDNTLIATISKHYRHPDVVFGPDCKYVATGCSYFIKITEVKTGTCMHTFPAYATEIPTPQPIPLFGFCEGLSFYIFTPEYRDRAITRYTFLDPQYSDRIWNEPGRPNFRDQINRRVFDTSFQVKYGYRKFVFSSDVIRWIVGTLGAQDFSSDITVNRDKNYYSQHNFMPLFYKTKTTTTKYFLKLANLPQQRDPVDKDIFCFENMRPLEVAYNAEIPIRVAILLENSCVVPQSLGMKIQIWGIRPQQIIKSIEWPNGTVIRNIGFYDRRRLIGLFHKDGHPENASLKIWEF